MTRLQGAHNFFFDLQKLSLSDWFLGLRGQFA